MPAKASTSSASSVLSSMSFSCSAWCSASVRRSPIMALPFCVTSGPGACRQWRLPSGDSPAAGADLPPLGGFVRLGHAVGDRSSPRRSADRGSGRVMVALARLAVDVLGLLRQLRPAVFVLRQQRAAFGQVVLPAIPAARRRSRRRWWCSGCLRRPARTGRPARSRRRLAPDRRRTSRRANGMRRFDRARATSYQ